MSGLSASSLRFLQDGDLSGMVKLVLHHSMQHVPEIVALAGNVIPQARVRQGCTVFTSALCVRFT